MPVNAASPMIPANASFMLASGGPVSYGCRKLLPCSCCCPNMSLISRMLLWFAFPNLGVSGGPYTINDIRTVYTGPVGLGQTSCPPVGYSCCDCSCQYGIKYRNADCSKVYPTCAHLPAVTAATAIPSPGGHLLGIGAVDMHCGPVGSGYPGGCNPPPAGHGAEPPPPAGRTNCGFLCQVCVQNSDCSGDLMIPDPADGGATNIGIGCFSGTLDCTTFTCQCPHGFYAKFGGTANGGLFKYPGFPGADTQDPDGYIVVTGVDTGPPCPDNWPCPPSIRDVPGHALVQRPSGLLVPGDAPGTFSPPVTRQPLPCVHQGNTLTAAERIPRGLDHRRNWLWCEHSKQPIGDVVCPCTGCGPGCPGYLAEEE